MKIFYPPLQLEEDEELNGVIVYDYEERFRSDQALVNGWVATLSNADKLKVTNTFGLSLTMDSSVARGKIPTLPPGVSPPRAKGKATKRKASSSRPSKKVSSTMILLANS